MDNTPQPFALGSVNSPLDYRDGYASALAVPAFAPATIPSSLKTQLASPMMQAHIPACVNHSVYDLVKLYWFLKTGKWIDFSPRFGDIMCKRFDGQDRATGGTYPRLALKIAATYGCPTTATLPNDTSLSPLTYRDDSLITPAVLAEAAQYKIPGYISIAKDLDSTKYALYLFGAISTLYEIGNELWTPSYADKDIDPMRTPKVIVGGHQMTPFGYEETNFIDVQNEWDVNWANGGRNKYDMNLWLPYIFEQWAIATIPKDAQSFISSLPSPTAFHYNWQTNMTLGDRNDDVKFAQIALMILGFLAPIPPDQLGIFGPKTASANARYQQANRIPVSANNIGPMTRGALNKQFAL